MDERAAKECNVVVHGLRESSRLEARERVQDDMDAFKQVVGVMGVVDGDEGIRFARRLGDREKGRNGEGRDKTVPRPLLIGFINKGIQERILDSLWRLVDSNNPDICRISVVRDLTARQRGREQEMVREAAKSNLERQQEDIVGNLAFKVVGRRGEKRIIKAPLRRGEVLNELGEVSWEEGNNFLGERRRLTVRRRLGEPSVSGANLEPIPIPQQVQHQHTRQELIPQLDGEGGGLEEQGGNEETEGGQADHPGEVRSLDYSWGQEREDHGEN